MPAIVLGQRTKIERCLILSGANELERRAPLFSARRDDYEGISFDFGQIQIRAAKIPWAPNPEKCTHVHGTLSLLGRDGGEGWFVDHFPMLVKSDGNFGLTQNMEPVLYFDLITFRVLENLF